MNLFAFGLGYSVQHFLRHHAKGLSVTGTVRSDAKRETLAADFPNVDVLRFDDGTAVEAALAKVDVLLLSAAPEESGDPALARYSNAIRAAPKLSRAIYLSTIGVYGDHDGAWIDESAELKPASKRNRARVDAERQWLSLDLPQRHTFILRLAGIYGPGRNQIENLRDGTARRVVKDGQVFNRIHVEDISRAIAACLTTDMPGGIINVTDDEPAPPQDVVTYAARLLGVPPPPEIPFEHAEMGPMALSFWGQNKRVRNTTLREKLGVMLACPTYREGLQSLR